MGISDKVEIEILAKVDQAVNGMQSLVLKAAEAYMGMKALKEIALGSLESFMAEEKSVAQMNAALRVTGQYSDTASAQLDGLAKALQGTTVYADDTARAAESVLMQLGNLSVNGVQKIMPLIADFSSSMGIDLVQAAEMVGKTLGGNTNMLSRYGIQIKDTKDKSAEFNEIIQQMMEKFGGMSEALAKTTGGRLEILKNQIDDLKESFGSYEAEVLNPIVKFLNTAFSSGAAMKVDPALEKSAQAIQGYIDAIVAGEKELASNPFFFFGSKGEQMKLYQEQLFKLSRRLKELNEEAANAPKSPFTNPNTADEQAAALAQINAQVDAYLYKIQHIDQFTAKQSTIPQAMAYYQGPAAIAPAPNDYGGMSPEYLEFMRNKAEAFNRELENSPPDMEAMAEASKVLAGQMQQVADAALAFGEAMASGDAQGAIVGLLQQLDRLFISYALTAAAAAATAAIVDPSKWAVMAFWLGMAGVGVAAGIGLSTMSSPPGGGSAPSSGRNITINNNIAGSVISERQVSRMVISQAGNW